MYCGEGRNEAGSDFGMRSEGDGDSAGQAWGSDPSLRWSKICLSSADCTTDTLRHRLRCKNLLTSASGSGAVRIRLGGKLSKDCGEKESEEGRGTRDEHYTLLILGRTRRDPALSHVDQSFLTTSNHPPLSSSIDQHFQSIYHEPEIEGLDFFAFQRTYQFGYLSSPSATPETYHSETWRLGWWSENTTSREKEARAKRLTVVRAHWKTNFLTRKRGFGMGWDGYDCKNREEMGVHKVSILTLHRSSNSSFQDLLWAAGDSVNRFPKKFSDLSISCETVSSREKLGYLHCLEFRIDVDRLLEIYKAHLLGFSGYVVDFNLCAHARRMARSYTAETNTGMIYQGNKNWSSGPVPQKQGTQVWRRER